MKKSGEKEKNKGRPKVLDLFAGAGGLSLGFEQAGFDIVGAVEYDPVHCAVHEFNFPYGLAICRDLSELSSEELSDLLGEENKPDVVCGGPPCQGFSLFGKRALDDPKTEVIVRSNPRSRPPKNSPNISQIRSKTSIVYQIPCGNLVSLLRTYPKTGRVGWLS